MSYGWADNAIVNIRWCGGIYYYNVVCGERILKIGYILTKLSLEVGGPLFGTQCMGSNWLTHTLSLVARSERPVPASTVSAHGTL